MLHDSLCDIPDAPLLGCGIGIDQDLFNLYLCGIPVNLVSPCHLQTRGQRSLNLASQVDYH